MPTDKKALVLSAGGLFAAYQVGVCEALWPYWRPDIVVGASAGALNAWMLASGASPEDLHAEWFRPESARAIKMFDPAPLLQRARRLHRDYPRRLPVGIVAVRVPWFRQCLFQDEEVTPEHLVATCSVPFFYPMQRVKGRRLVDGGLFEATPVWAAASMGATSAIAINCLPNVLPWPIHVALSAVRRLRKMPVSPELKAHFIRPSGWMGTAREAMVWNRGNVERWLELGRKDGEEFVKENLP